MQSHYAFEEYPITERLSAAVNLANGNLVIHAQDVAINGPEIGLGLSRFYNSHSLRAGAFGTGWSITGGQDVGLEVGPSSVVFRAPSGFRATFTEEDGEWVGPSGLNADLEQTGNGQWEVTYRGNDEKLVFTAGGYLLRHESQNGNTLEYAYNADNTVASVTDAAGRVTQFDYDGGLLSSIEDPAGRTTQFTYDGGRRLRTTVAADGSTTLFGYNTLSLVAAIVTEEQVRVNINYHQDGRVRQIHQVDASGLSDVTLATVGYEYAGSVTTLIDAGGQDWDYVIDDAGRVISTTDPLGRTRAQEWTPNSAIASATDAMDGGGNITTFSYDEVNNPTAVTLPTGAAASATYTTDGACGSTSQGHPYRVKCATDPAGNETTYDYDEAGNLLAQRDSTDTGGREISYTYQGTEGTSCGAFPGQRCSATNGEGHTTSYGYDADGNLNQITPPAPLGATSYTYDAVGRLLTSTDGAGAVSTYEYDVMDRLTRQSFADGMEVITVYDDDGRRTSETTTFAYDPDPASATQQWSYDARGLITAQDVTWGVYSAQSSFEHDARGNLTSLTDEQGTVTYSYDAANQVTQVVVPGGSCPSSGCIRFAYDNNGNEILREFNGRARVENTYDAANRPVRIQALTVQGTPVSDFSYNYTDDQDEDRAMIQSRTDHVGQAAPAGSVIDYSYDSLNRLTSAVEQDTAGVVEEWTYAYDHNGNRTEANGTTYTYNAADQLTQIDGQSAGVTYDATGGMTTTPAGMELLYDDSTQLRGGQSATGAEFRNIYLGATNATRLIHRTPQVTVRYQNTPLGWTNRERVESGAFERVVRHPGGSPLAVFAGTTRYLATDALGTPTVQFTANGAVQATFAHDPYGQPRERQPAFIGYAAGTYEAISGLTKFGARYYNPELGTFTQPDPSGIENNPYQYATSNPISFADPTGLASGHIIGEGCVLVCLSIGGGTNAANSDSGIFVGASVGPSIGWQARAGASSQPLSSGVSLTSTCSASGGPFGAHVGGELSLSPLQPSTSAGPSFGLGASCTVGAGYWWV